MTNQFVARITPYAWKWSLVAGVLLLSVGVGTNAADDQQGSAARILNGYWAAPPPTIAHETDVHPDDPHDQPPNAEPPARLARLLQPWAAEIHDKYLELIAARRALSLETPTPDNNCLPFAIPSEGSAPYGFPLQFLVTPKRVYVLMQLDHQMRIVRINGTHPASLKPSWYGDSIGRWEGSALVIDTIGFEARAEIQEFPGGGWPHTSQMHTVERYRVSSDGSKLSADWTYEDPGALTAPFKTNSILLRGKPYQEFINSENNVEFPCPNAETGSAYRALTLASVEEMLNAAKSAAAARQQEPKKVP